MTIQSQDEFILTIHAKKDIDKETLQALVEMAKHLDGLLSIERATIDKVPTDTVKLIQCRKHKSQVYPDTSECVICALHKKLKK
jgi:hypothetical protein